MKDTQCNTQNAALNVDLFTISFLFTFADDCRAREARVLSARSSADADALSADADALGTGSKEKKISLERQYHLQLLDIILLAYLYLINVFS